MKLENKFNIENSKLVNTPSSVSNMKLDHAVKKQYLSKTRKN